MSLQVGSRLGPYEITARLGAGGMGEVFRARDTKLNRDVAIKVLPAAFAQDAERVARFRREAQLLASFNHPNIAGIYGLEESEGVVALTLELVEGEDLAERMKRGPIPVDEAIAIAKQIAEGLEAAHEKGIVHRDLKPANVKLTKDGTVKLLDFGLAKAYEGDAAATGGSRDVSNSPTMSRQMTEAGIILGTAAYMSPEQARGKPLDKRSDIWSFGVLLFEMLTGRRAFRGGDVSETLAAVLRDTPAFDALPANTPASVRRLLARCLERDPRRRLRDIGDARWELDVLEAGPATGAGAAGTRRLSPLLALGSIVAVALAAAAAGWMLKPKPLPQAQPLIRASYPIGAPLRLTAQRRQIAISPDGRFIATVVGLGLSVRRVDQLAATALKGTTGVAGVFFSPDSRWIGFSTDTAIKKVPVEAGEVSVVAETGGAISSGPVGASWGDDGRIYYGSAGGIRAVSANGGASQVVVSGSNLGHPHVLPGSRLLLFTRGHSASVFATRGEVVLHSFDGGDDFVLTTGASPRYLKTGHLLVARGSTILAAPLDLQSRRLLKEPVAVAQEVAMFGSFAQYDVSETGTLVHIPGSAESNPLSLLRRVGSSGASSPLGRTPREYSDPRVSPDGRLIALHLQDQQNDVWTMDIARDSLTRLTFDPQEDETPVWSPDGLWLAFSGYARQGTGRGIFRRRVDGSGVEEVLWSLDQHSHVTDWSRDGQTLVLDVLHPERQADIELLELGATSRLRPYLETPFAESSGRVSPDGRWLAYRSNESGRNEIYVQAFPTAGSKLQVSTNGGVQPVWSRDGRALFYRSDSGLMVARSSGGPSLGLQAPVLLFEDTYGRPQGEGHTSYDLLPDGRFVFIKSIDTPEATAANPFLIATFNWVHDIETRVPVSRVP